MMKYIALSTIFFSLILGFQNCGQPGTIQSGMDVEEKSAFPDGSNDSGGPGLNSPGTESPPEPGSVNPGPNSSAGSKIPSLAAMEVMTSPTMSQDATGRMTRIDGQNLLIDLKTGAIAELDIEGQAKDSPRRCLNPNDLSILASIFNSALLCEKRRVSTTTGTLCAMRYQMPYARLHPINGESIELGESRSSCDDGIDLCGANQDLLKAFITNLLSHLQEKVCAD
jgi:hypothetical protein